MSNKKEYSVVMLLIASVLVGTGVGLLTNPVPGILIGLGVGFALAAVVAIFWKA